MRLDLRRHKEDAVLLGAPSASLVGFPAGRPTRRFLCSDDRDAHDGPELFAWAARFACSRDNGPESKSVRRNEHAGKLALETLSTVLYPFKEGEGHWHSGGYKMPSMI